MSFLPEGITVTNISSLSPNTKAALVYNSKTTEFQIWKGFPQIPKPVINTFRRLGADRQRVQILGKQANPSQSLGIVFLENHVDIDEKILDMIEMIGKHVQLYYYGRIFQNVLIMDVTYNIKNEGAGDIQAAIYFNITYLVDGEPEAGVPVDD